MKRIIIMSKYKKNSYIWILNQINTILEHIVCQNFTVKLIKIWLIKTLNKTLNNIIKEFLMLMKKTLIVIN